MSTPGGPSRANRVYPGHILLLGLLGAYLNIAAYGFRYGEVNHEFELPLVNWLRDPTLYPHDAIRDGFTRFPTFFWTAVAYLSRWLSTEHILFGFFLITKALFFLALARLLAGLLEDVRMVACIVLAAAFSPVLNNYMPLSGSNLLDPVQTNTTLAIALLLWSGVFLIEKRWLGAALVCAVTICVNALFVVYTFFVFLAFAVHDWRQQKRDILLATALGAAIAIPWLVRSPDAVPTRFPRDYVQALLMLYPYHCTLRIHPLRNLLCEAGLVVAAFLMAAIAAKVGLNRHRRLEILTASYLVPVVLGAFCGASLLTPNLARVQLLRAESFLVPYSSLLAQVYGASLLLALTGSGQTIRGVNPGATFFLGVFAILLPLSDDLSLLPFLFFWMLLWVDPSNRFEKFCRGLARSWAARAGALLLSVAGIVLAAWADANWTATAIILLLTLSAGSFLYRDTSAISLPAVSKLGFAACALVLLMLGGGTILHFSSFWNPVLAPEPRQADWFEVQRWAKVHTPRQAQFLVPTWPGGFRIFSERASWGEWKDGGVAYWDPPFAEIYLQRMGALGLHWDSKWIGFEKMVENYRCQSWEHLVEIARENELDYVVQFQDVGYPVSPVFANKFYAVYKVPR